MDDFFDICTTENNASGDGRILIVDDDPIVAGMLGVSLTAAGYNVAEVYSGEEALTELARAETDLLPDIIFLDIEMGAGIDGYETCRRMRAADATSGLYVIFLSGHDDLSDRLNAYDAGASDFMSKPFLPDEVLRKVQLAIHHRRQIQTNLHEKRFSFDAAMTALSSLGESGVTLKFCRGALGCRSLRSLAALTIESMSAYEINCHVQLRTPTETLTLTPKGPASPLEESVIEKMRGMERVFSFRDRLIINYDNVSLLITNMPIDNDELCGRMRDQATMIAEAAELAVGNISLRMDASMRADAIRKLTDISRKAIDELRGNYRDLQLATRLELENVTSTIEGMYVHLGLVDHQENTISHTLRDAVECVLALFERSSELDKNFAAVVNGLMKAGEYEVPQDDDTSAAVELW